MIHKFVTFNENIFKPKKLEGRHDFRKKKDDEFLESIEGK